MELGWGWGWRRGTEPGPSNVISHISHPAFRSCPTPQLRRMQEMLQKMKQQMQDQ